LGIILLKEIQNSIDPKSELNKYWLNSMIRNVDYFKKIYQELEIDDVNVSVHVGVERCFSTTFPKEMKKSTGSISKMDTSWTWSG